MAGSALVVRFVGDEHRLVEDQQLTFERAADLVLDDANLYLHRSGGGDEVGERPPLEQVHDEERPVRPGDARGEDGDDRRVPGQPPDRTALPEEAVAGPGRPTA